MENKKILEALVVNYGREEVGEAPEKECKPQTYTSEGLNKEDIVSLLKASRESGSSLSAAEILEAIKELRGYDGQEFIELVERIDSGDLREPYVKIYTEYLKSKKEKLMTLNAKKEAERIEKERIRKIKEANPDLQNNFKNLSEAIGRVVSLNQKLGRIFLKENKYGYSGLGYNPGLVPDLMAGVRNAKKIKKELLQELSQEKLEIEIPVGFAEETLKIAEKVSKEFRKTKKETGSHQEWVVKKEIEKTGEGDSMVSLCEKSKNLINAFDELLEKYEISRYEIRPFKDQDLFNQD